MKSKVLNFLLLFNLFLGLTSVSHAEVLFYDDFTDGFNWSTNSNAVYIKDNDFLYIGADRDEFVGKDLPIALSNDYTVTFEQRIKLEKDGLNYRLPRESIFVEGSSRPISVTYLPDDIYSNDVYGWHFGIAGVADPDSWTGSHINAVPGEGWWTTATADYWAVTRIVMTADGGQLYVKPDDPDRGWFEDDFSLVASREWAFSEITRVSFHSSWNSVSYVDYIKIYIGSMEVDIDIKPGACPNPFNVESNGVLPVAILGTEDLDITGIDIASIRLGGVAPLRSSIEDVSQPANIEHCDDFGPDYYDDLTLKFDTQAIAASLGDVTDGDEIELTLAGALSDGTIIEGIDSVIIIKKEKKQRDKK